ncbi:hypothetical protein B0H19DRAFT_1080094 [Mycena capillaripes]|nr:hypothetical protein B0H19DRAFT_1080094 [Mycena capillaripes]
MTVLHTGERSHQLDWWLCTNSLLSKTDQKKKKTARALSSAKGCKDWESRSRSRNIGAEAEKREEEQTGICSNVAAWHLQLESEEGVVAIARNGEGQVKDQDLSRAAARTEILTQGKRAQTSASRISTEQEDRSTTKTRDNRGRGKV